MKVTTVPPPKQFMPITIVLESEEEAVAMWHRLNAATNRISDNLETHDALIKDDLCGKMWRAFNNQYTPEVTK